MWSAVKDLNMMTPEADMEDIRVEHRWTTLYRKSYICIPRHTVKLRGLVLNSSIHVFVSDLYIPRIGLPIWLQQNMQNNPGNIKVNDRYMNVEIGRQNIIIMFFN